MMLKQLFSLGYHVFSNRRIQLVFTFLNTKKHCDYKFSIFRIISEFVLPVLIVFSSKRFVYRNLPLRVSGYQADIHIAWALKALFMVVEMVDALNEKLIPSK